MTNENPDISYKNKSYITQENCTYMRLLNHIPYTEFFKHIFLFHISFCYIYIYIYIYNTTKKLNI